MSGQIYVSISICVFGSDVGLCLLWRRMATCPCIWQLHAKLRCKWWPRCWRPTRLVPARQIRYGGQRGCSVMCPVRNVKDNFQHVTVTLMHDVNQYVYTHGVYLCSCVCVSAFCCILMYAYVYCACVLWRSNQRVPVDAGRSSMAVASPVHVRW